MDISHIPCEEASILSRETYIPCSRPSEKFVYHSKDRRVYAMCPQCAHHNIKNRGGIELVPA